MIKHKKEEFFAWLEEDSSRKSGYGWAIFYNKGELVLDKLIQKEVYEETNYRHFNWDGMRAVVLNWVGEKEIASLKQKLTNYLNQRKTTIQQELTLLKETLNHD